MNQLPATSLIRQYCDGELPRADVDRIEAAIAADPAIAERVAFERRLRDRVVEVMDTECPGAPAGLAERIGSEFAQAEAPHAAVEPGQAASDGSWWWRLAALFQGPPRANVFAVAASLTLVLGAVLVGIFGTQIDNWHWHQSTINLVDKAVPFVSGEHRRCLASADVLEKKIRYQQPADAGVQLSAWLGAEVGAESMCKRLRSAGWSFLGAGPCGVPVSERSAHMIYRRDGVAGEAMLSIFMVADTGRYQVVTPDGDSIPVTPGRWISVNDPTANRDVWIYSNGDVVYLMVGPDFDLTDAASALHLAIGR